MENFGYCELLGEGAGAGKRYATPSKIIGGLPTLPPMLCYAMPCHAMPCHAMPCHAMPCHAMPCYAMLCYAIFPPTHIHIYLPTLLPVEMHSYLICGPTGILVLA